MSQEKGDDTRTHPAREPVARSADRVNGLPYAEREHYAIRREHARGGRGRVLAAHDNVLARPVAIKELLAPDPEASTRFIKEALLTARLQHPAIVPIYEAGRWPDGEPFYAMKFVAGRSLKEAIGSARDARARLGLLPHVITVADAIAYAHSLRIVHRDIKPANIILGDFGETLVVDWGLAKDLAAVDAPEPSRQPSEPAPDETATGSILGTPHYMPPEQARGEPIDERADVYALGAVLYHVLAGEPPYAGATWTETLAKVLAGPPPPLPSTTPAELAGIVAHAMARDPEARYASARELADDLRRFQTGQLVASHHYSAWSHVARWVRRHRVPVALTVAFAIALAVIGGLGIARTSAARHAAEDRNDHLILLQARNALDRDPAAALAWLQTYPIETGDYREVRTIFEEARGRGAVAIVPTIVAGAVGATPSGTLRFLGEHAIIELDPRSGAIHRTPRELPPDYVCADVAPRGERAVIGDHRGLVLLDLETGASRRLAMPGGELEQNWCGFSEDGRHVVFAVASGIGWLDVDTGAGVVFHGEGAAGRFAADHRTLAWSGWPARVLHVVDLATGTSTDWSTGDQPVSAVALSDDHVVAVTRTGELFAWTRDGRLAHELPMCAFPTIATKLVSGKFAIHCADGRVRLVRADDGAIEEVGMTGRSYGWIGTPDGTVLAAVGVGGGLAANAATGESAALVFDDDGEAGRFSADGAYVAITTLESRKAYVFRTPPFPDRVVPAGAAQFTDAIVAPDGRSLAIAHDGAFRCELDAVTCTQLATTPPTWLGLAPDGRRLGYSNDARSGWLGADARVIAGPVVGAAWSPVANLVALGESRRRLELVDAGGRARTLADDLLAYDLVWSRDGRRLAWRDGAGTVTALELATERRWRFAGDPPVNGLSFSPALAFTPDGHSLIGSSAAGHALHVWNLDTGADDTVTPWHDLPMIAAAVSLDGRTVATTGNDRTVRTLDLITHETRVIANHRAEVWQLAISPDGRTIASGSLDSTIRLADIATGDVRILRGHATGIRSLAFTPRGDRLVSSSNDRLMIWDLAHVPPPLGDAAAVRAAIAAETTVVLGSDDRPITP